MSLLWGGVDQVWLSKSCCLPTRGSNEWVWSPGLQSSENLSEGFESDFGFEVLIRFAWNLGEVPTQLLELYRELQVSIENKAGR